MKEFFRGALVNAKYYGDTEARIAELKKLQGKQEYKVSDLSKFGTLMPREKFEEQYPFLSDNLHKDCTDVWMYLQNYFVQALSNGKFHNNQFTKRGKTDKSIKKMEEYIFEKIEKMSKESLVSV